MVVLEEITSSFDGMYSGLHLELRLFHAFYFSTGLRLDT